ncbi:MAG TPA: DNA topoisomerase 3 [Gaiellales bacterium]|nr:DNA topoisomerase 3 [Gaiellales bacterium]
MGKTLVIAEKPSVARDYAKALGERFTDHKDHLESDDHVISWAVGHLIELAEPDDYDDRYRVWSLNRLPIIPERFELRPIEGRSRKQLDVLRKQLARKDVDAVVNGCDAGREGELIFDRVMEFSASQLPVRRLWVSSMTGEAIREGFTRLRAGSELEPLRDAARSRAEADWLVGMNGTRAATKAGRLDGVVSLGRVQTPTLALIVRRDLEIDAFVPETYFQVEGRFLLDGDREYRGRWFDGKHDRTPDRERAETVAAAATGADAEVVSLKRRQRRQRSPLLFDLTSLQREANRRFGISAQRTLQAAQRLYEGSTAGAVITYPRTRSQFLPRDQVPALKSAARALAGIDAYRPHAEYVAGLDVLPLARVVNDAKVDDHHAIIPTGELPRGRLEGDDARVYDLVCRRFLAVFHPDAQFEDTEVVTEAGGHRFRTRGERLVEAGWRAPAFGDEPEPAADGEQADDDRQQALPRIEQGERGRCPQAEVQEKQTKPPGRYTESSLLGAMETAGRTIDDDELREAMKDAGLGTPATRADTIERLIQVGYVERERGKSLVSTAKGRGTIALLGEHALTSAELTGEWERRLAEIEQGTADRARFMNDIASFTTGLVDYFRGVHEQTLGACPNGDGEIRENRAAFGCSSYRSKSEPGCGFTVWKRQQGYTIGRDQVAALLADGRVDLGGDPPATLMLGEGNLPVIVGADGAPVEDRRAIGPCPNDDGEIRENRAAFGCSSWKSKSDPGCGFTIWKSQRGFTITADQVRALLEQGGADLDGGPQPARLVLDDDRQPAIVGEDGKPLARAARSAREPIAACPKCDGEIRENSRAFGCSSWKSRKNPGCGFVIWKSTKGREITADDARHVIEQGHTDWLDFRDRGGPFRGRLVLQDDRTVAVEREGEGVRAA